MRKLSAFILAALLSVGALAQTVSADPNITGKPVAGSNGFGTVTSVSCGTPTQGVTCSVASPTGAPVVTLGLESSITTTASTATFATTAGSATSATNATTVTTNANLTGPVSSTGNTTTLTAVTGTGSTIVLATSPVLTTPRFATSTWANLPSAGSNTYTFAIASDLGTNGTMVESNGARWRPWNGFTVLNSMAATTTSVAGTDTIVCQTLLPTNSWQNNDIVRVWLTMTKSGATDNGLITVHVGTAGTISDTAITGLSAFAFMGATGLAQGGTWDVKLISATSAQKVGNNSNTSPSYGPVGTTAAAVATTITSAAANPLWVSVGIKSSSTNNTVGADVCRIELHTP